MSAFIFGFHAVSGRIRQNPQSVIEVYLDAGRRDPRAKQLALLLETHKIKVSYLDSARMDGMAGNGRNQGVVARVDASKKYIALDDVLDTLTEDALLLVLDGIQDPHNLGACMRVADAFGVHAVIAPKDRAVGLNATVAKVASGAAETVPYVTVTNLARTLRELKEAGITVIGTDEEGASDLYETELAGPIAWVLGAEGSGMRRLTRESCDRLVRIPMCGMVESLNLSVTSGILMFETCRQRRLSKEKG
ncbi:MAG: 23S rRNA (guanosine(2251)-2'-O)-methyltransferase RlmB [Burkholderiales bacterium]|nr:23S rRNA (guanosine(2251)-2'-O)-methyltransferase RlmB [Burkholderiales bacterium]